MGLFMSIRYGFVVLASLGLFSCARTPSADVAATVNKRPITYAELDRTIKAGMGAGAASTNDDQAQLQRLDVLRTMIDNEIMLQRAEKMGLMATDSEVDTKLNEIRTPFTKEEFDKQLKSRAITLDELRVQLRRDLSLQKLINKEITSKINITDSDVTAFYNANKASFNFPEPRIRLAQIVVTAAPTTVNNLKNNKAQNDQQAVQKIQAIEARLKQGEDFSVLAQNYSEDQPTASSGGDLGFLPESQFDKNADLKKIILSMNPGEFSKILHNEDGYRILKMISKEPAGQHELNDPRVQQQIRTILLNRKDQLLKFAYSEVARNDVKVVNALAKQVADNMSKGGK
jgi:peptidyl-prolyl cis-trans isomerase SurA